MDGKKAGQLSLLALVILMLVKSGAALSTSQFQASDPPAQIHLTWQSNDTARTIVVTWRTATAEAGDKVLYDTTSRGGDPKLYKFSATGSHHTFSGLTGYIHDVELTGLSPNTTYYFICGGEAGGYSSERSFRTAPDRRAKITFVAGGDSRDNPTMRDTISRAMSSFNPSFVLYTGDAVGQGSVQAQWDDWFVGMDSYWVGTNGLTIPIIPCLGNHEGMATNYFEQFSLPGNEQWFSLDWGPDLHIIVLNSEVSITGEQLGWLASDLAAHENYLWKVAIFHRPAFSGGRHGSHVGIQAYWAPLFDDYHVDLVFTGHDHLYERTHPINYTLSKDAPMPSPENGTVYIVSGGWGAPLYTGSERWWTAKGPDSRYHFTIVDIYENGLLHLRAIDKDGNVFDEYTIQKTVSEEEGEGEPVSLSPLVIGAVAAAVACAAIAFYLLKARK